MESDRYQEPDRSLIGADCDVGILWGGSRNAPIARLEVWLHEHAVGWPFVPPSFHWVAARSIVLACMAASHAALSWQESSNRGPSLLLASPVGARTTRRRSRPAAEAPLRVPLGVRALHNAAGPSVVRGIIRRPDGYSFATSRRATGYPDRALLGAAPKIHPLGSGIVMPSRRGLRDAPSDFSLIFCPGELPSDRRRRQPRAQADPECG